MKKIFIYISLFALLLSSCAKDYLNTAPTSSVTGSQIFESTDNMKMAINGLNKLFCKQWFSSQGWNGQGTTMLYYGEYQGDELTVNALTTSYLNTINGSYHDSYNTTYCIRPWHLYYMVIGNANSILENASKESVSGLDSEKEFIKAQAWTYRAYCYYYLTQLYGPRWTDSEGGTKKAVVLRIDTSTGDAPLESLGKCYDQIYADLDSAILNFKNSGKDRTNNYEMGIDVAYALYSRVALAKQDWQKAYDMASVLIDAKDGAKTYPLMSVADYKKGFCHANDEWIWYLVGNGNEDLYYYSFAAYMGWNVQASQCRTNPKSISKQIYDQIPATDIRKKMFLDPDNPYYGEAPAAPAKISFDKSSGKVTATASKNLAYQYAKDADFINGHAGFPLTTFTPYAYMHFKFGKDASMAGTAITDVPLFRMSEIYLNRAEAGCMLGGKYLDQAKNDMIELVKDSKRDEEFVPKASQSEFLEQIKLYTRIELWGEGFNWFNLKRWGDTIVRKTFADGGSWASANAITIKPEDVHAWTWVTPRPEVDYNHGLNGDTTPPTE